VSNQREEYVQYTKENHVVRITLNRPKKHNAMNAGMHEQLVASIHRFNADADAHFGVLGANGPSFCAGRDISAQAEGWDMSGDIDRTINQYGLPPVEKPLISAGRGHMIGAGGYFWLAGDIRLASRRVNFALPEVPTAVLGPYWLEHVEHLPRAVAFRLSVMGDPLGADDLMRLNLATEIVDDDQLDAAVNRWLERLSALPPQHVAATKRLMRRHGYQHSPEILNEEIAVRIQLDKLDDSSEAARAFVEKRKPQFTGR
jgi:2-(1,2-epoxy-1,2-dihydrophenyl)acetyl-CoA isomerase